jgi:hypothetical protein
MKLGRDEVFALRHGETIQSCLEQPKDGKWLAIMLRSVSMPAGPRQVERDDGKPVEAAAVLAAGLLDGKWQWVQLSPSTKEVIGDLFYDSSAPLDRWLYLVVS